jgi:hypothetical protein
MVHKPNPLAPRRANPLTNLKPIHGPTAIAARALQGAAKARGLCPNKQCHRPKIEDGVCTSCGTIVDDANIVAEIQFGENSSGAAVVQGSFVSADQGAAKSLGPAFRRAGGSEDREKTLREGGRRHARSRHTDHRRKTNYGRFCGTAQALRGATKQWYANLQACCYEQFHSRAQDEHGGSRVSVYGMSQAEAVQGHAHRLCGLMRGSCRVQYSCLADSVVR